MIPLLKSSIIEVIGNTPMVELNRLVQRRGLKGRLLAKLEYLNPSLSKKDRIALEMIQQAKADGLLKDGQTVIELTSGNTGTGLAMVCKALGHPFIAVMSRGNTQERVRMMQAFGAEVILVDQAPGSLPNQVSGEDLAFVEVKTQQLVMERKAYRANQFENQSNCFAHEKTTGFEIWEQSNYSVDVFLDFIGTGGTFAGVTRFLREKNKKLRSYLIEPAGVAILAGQSISKQGHQIQGGGYNKENLPLLDKDLVTDYLQVTDEEAIEGARILAAEEGILGGFSTGANLSAALKLLQTKEQGATCVFLVPDSGLKYLSTSLYL